MPFARKTLTTLLAETVSDIAASLPGSDALLRFSSLNIVAKIQAAMSNSQFGYLDWIAKQSVPFTAEDEALQGWSALKNVYLKAPSSAVLTAQFSGTQNISAGTPITRSDGAQYTVNATAVPNASNVITVTMTAVTPGTAGNSTAGTQCGLGTAISGVQSSGTITGTVTAGADVETNDALRTRMLAAWQNTPQGGASNDYLGWTLAVPGVTRAWIAPNGFGAGTVVVYTMWDNAESANAGFPQGTQGVSQYDKGPKGLPRAAVASGDLLAVADAIVTKEPVTALVWSVAPVANNLTFTISGLMNASATTKAAISAAIADVFFRNGSPLAGTINRSDIESAIAAISGTAGFVITLVQGNVSGTVTTYPGNIVSAFGQLPVLAGVNYVT